MVITIITLFPEVFSSVFNSSIIARVIRDGQIKINYVNLRDFGIGRHQTVDDTPYGGGVGMVLRVDVLDAAINSVRTNKKSEAVILLDPKGEIYKQESAEKFSKYDHLILICGRYEGFDERIRELVDFEISVGDYVLSGGEIPAMIIIESVVRLIPGVLKKEEAAQKESFSKSISGRIFEAGSYTRPPIYKKMEVPKILLSGNFGEIEKYRAQTAKKVTKKRRPDLLAERLDTRD